MAVQKRKQKILICDDDPKITYAVKMILENDGHQVITANAGRQCLELLQAQQPDVVFLDITMPAMSGLEVLEKAKEMKIDVPIIMITGYGTMETAIKAMHLGAYEYVTKPLDMEKIRILTRRVLDTQKLKQELAGLRQQINGQRIGHAVESEFPDETIIGKTPAIQDVFKMIGIVSATPGTTSVLIRGESGTGKELVARAIHDNSANKAAPFVIINCTAMPENLLESELFGHEKGAFTSAVERKLGKLEMAKNGTIFFDEIGDLSPNMQQKLLRLLQEREFERVGSNQVMKVEARFIFATHRHLEEQVKAGHFREDLFFRINVVPIVLPPLRERKEDIPLLVDHFVKKFNRKLGKEVSAVCPQAMDALVQYDHPGNVRELGNIIERCMTLSSGAALTFDSLPEILKGQKPETFGNIPITSFEMEKARRDVLNGFEKKFLEEILRATHGNVEEAAQRAKIRRQSFYRLLKKHAIFPKDFK